MALTIMPDLSKRLLTVTSKNTLKQHYLSSPGNNVSERSDKY